MYKNEILKAKGSKYLNSETILVVNYEPVTRKDSPLDKLVYSKNQFGWPSNDIQFKENTSNSEVRQALERRQMPIPSKSNGVDDDDIALDMVMSQDETIVDYADRLQPYIDKAKDALNSDK